MCSSFQVQLDESLWIFFFYKVTYCCRFLKRKYKIVQSLLKEFSPTYQQYIPCTQEINVSDVMGVSTSYWYVIHTKRASWELVRLMSSLRIALIIEQIFPYTEPFLIHCLLQLPACGDNSFQQNSSRLLQGNQICIKAFYLSPFFMSKLPNIHCQLLFCVQEELSQNYILSKFCEDISNSFLFYVFQNEY